MNNELYERDFPNEYETIRLNRLKEKEENQELEKFSNLFNEKLNKNHNKYIKLKPDYLKFISYESFYIKDNKYIFDVYISNSNDSLLLNCYVDKYHCGWNGLIHGGASYFLTFLGMYIIIKEKERKERCQYKINNFSTKYKQKVQFESNLIIEANLYLKKGVVIVISSKLINYLNEVCVETKFEMEKLEGIKF